MERLRLSNKAKESIKRLVNSKDSERVGDIAAIDPRSSDMVSYGKTVVEASNEGRRIKNDTKSAFYFVRVGYPSVHVLKGINLQGYIAQEYFPKIKGYVHDRNLHLLKFDTEKTIQYWLGGTRYRCGGGYVWN